MTLRKGLQNWDSAKEAALDLALTDIVEEPELSQTEQSGTLDFLAHFMRLDPRQTEVEIVQKLNGQIDFLLQRAFGDIDTAISRFFSLLENNDFVTMDALELERLILSVQKTIYMASDIVTDLYNDAYFADRIQQDEYWGAYRQPTSVKTKDDRQAYAYEVTRDSRFFYYYRYMLWRRLADKLSALRELQRTLEYYRMRSQKDRPF